MFGFRVRNQVCQKPGGSPGVDYNARHPRLTMCPNALQLPGGGWAQLELTDALTLALVWLKLLQALSLKLKRF